MKTKFTYSIITALAIVGATFYGCSSSGGSSDETVALVTEVGTFRDAPVDGLRYDGLLDGTTEGGGHYNFKGTTKVGFYLGDSIKLGALTPSTMEVSVLNLFDPVKTINDVNDGEVVNLLRLLQTLDADGTPGNGITITPQAIAYLEAALVTEYFPTLSDVNFNLLNEGNVTAILQSVVDANATDGIEAVVMPTEAVDHFLGEIIPPAPSTEINGTALACINFEDTTVSTDLAADYNVSLPITKRNVSSTSLDDVNRLRGNSHNIITPIEMMTVPAKKADGSPIDGNVHPIVIAYLEEVVGTEYEMGDGSADIGDPDQRDALKLAISLDDGDTWKIQTVSDSTAKSSIDVSWAGKTIEYGGHAQKPAMAVYDNRILLAWNDKYCPSGNTFDLNATTVDGSTTYEADVFSINGTQGSILYTADKDGGVMIAPNGKEVYEVPFSCVWTARGFVAPDGNITWHAPVQLTTGKRDSNHIWAAASSVGFAMAWQEDTSGLRSGKGAGPGEGWSGATTNHGSDIWYTSIKWDEFDDENETSVSLEKPTSKYNFHYPVRITDNEKCVDGDTKAYCRLMCATYGYETSTSLNQQGTVINSCKTSDVDMLDDSNVTLDGDTGASRSALKILKTNAENEFVVVLAYEETKGLSENTTGTGDQDQGEDLTNIELEGKSVYFESFNFNAIDAFDENDISTILTTPMPLVSAGNIVNMKGPDQNTSNTDLIYENARRVVIGTHVDACKANNFTFALLYKQSFDTQGASSDMFVRVNNGFTYESFVPLATGYGQELNATNISAQAPYDQEANASSYVVNWSADNLDDITWTNTFENTFSPRIILRGDGVNTDSIYAGFAYTPNDTKTSQENMPSNFHVHTYMNGKWQGPVNVTGVTKASGTTVDARLFTTPKGRPASYNGLVSDQSDPNMLFLTWGEIDWIDDTNHDLNKSETNLYYKRAIYDAVNGWVWDAEAQHLATRDGGYVEEKEVNSFASPDGKIVYNVWIQESEEAYFDANTSDPFRGLDTWFGRMDFNVSNIVTPD